MQQIVVFLLLVVVSLAQYPTAPRYGVYNNNYYSSYGTDPRMYYQQQYAQQQQPQHYGNGYNSYSYPYKYEPPLGDDNPLVYSYNYNNYYGGYGSGYSNSYAQPQMGFMGMHNDGNGNLRIGNDLAALYITCNGRGCPVRG